MYLIAITTKCIAIWYFSHTVDLENFGVKKFRKSLLCYKIKANELLAMKIFLYVATVLSCHTYH